MVRCPNCQVNLMMTERQGVEIDYCPECRGVWLDRGELDKIVVTATPPAADPVPNASMPYRREADDDVRYDERSRRKRGGLLDLIDFG
jgi:Zn-finger nucleic acid-binding protein